MMTVKGIDNNRIKSFFSNENIVLFLLIFFGLFFRFLTMTNIETGGDAASVWFAAKRIYYGLPYDISHHSARFGMIIPVYLSQVLFGTHPIVYYTTPLLFFVLQIIFIYKIAVRAYGVNLGYLSGILFVFSPKMFSHAIQVKPDGYCAAYILISFYLLFKFMDAQSKSASYKYIFLSAVFMFCAYMSKETSLFFLPGLAICILLMKKEFKYVFVFGAILFALFLGETSVYYFTMGLKLGRIEIVTGSHLSSGNLLALPSFWSLFTRYASLNVLEKIYFLTYLMATIYLIILLRKEGLDKRIKLLLIMPFVFFVLLTFAVKSVNPFVPAMSFNPRHLVPATPFMILVISCFFVSFFDSSRIARWGRGLVEKGKTVHLYAGITSGLSLVCLLAILILLPLFPQASRDSFFGEHPIKATFEYYTILNNAYEKGIPIIQEKIIAGRWKKPVDAVQSLMKKGLSQKKACEKAEVTEKDYLYCLKRVRRGDYKTFKIFTHIFWNNDFTTDHSLSLPEKEKIEVRGRDIGFMVNDDVKKNKDYAAGLFVNDNDPVVVMREKPIRVKEMTLKEFFNKKSK
ncbi:MAG TPA: glycosyltransferase family 39 protein [Spirochaetota bacterium]|nr:glycosyltransferase family 39 protein [Spirochaetota bacterium]